jgi:hypothetical protein
LTRRLVMSATVIPRYSAHQRLSFSGEVGHFGDDRFFLTAIQTQGLLLYMCLRVAPEHAYLQRPTVLDIHPSAAGSPSALAQTSRVIFQFVD